MQVSWDMKQQLKLLHAPGAGLAPVTVADPIVDARVALWLLYPNSGNFTDSQELASAADRVQALSAQAFMRGCVRSLHGGCCSHRGTCTAPRSTYPGLWALSWACSLCVCARHGMQPARYVITMIA